jgi:hypothetical protein
MDVIEQPREELVETLVVGKEQLAGSRHRWVARHGGRCSTIRAITRKGRRDGRSAARPHEFPGESA